MSNLLLLLLLQASAETIEIPPLIVAPTVENSAPVVMSSREVAYLSRIYSAREAVMAAADKAPKGYLGRFAFSVRAIGWQDGRLYLNSEEDYRDPRNLSVMVPPDQAKTVLDLLGGTEREALASKMVLVTGLATRTRINFIGADGRPSGKYYYQTQVPINLAHKVKVIALRR